MLIADTRVSAGATKNLEESADKSTEALGADENGDETTGLPL
jgi:hypothetical protein